MRNKLVAFTLLLLILIFGFINASASSNKAIILTDPVTDLTYEVSYNNKVLTIFLNGDAIGSTYVQDINSFALFANTLYLFYADNMNLSLFIYCFDFYNDSIYSFAVSEDAFYNENCFATDGERFYFVSGKDTKTLCIYENETINKFNLKSQIAEILLIDSGVLIIITSEGTFLYKDYEIINSDICLSPDIKYIGSGIITDSTGREFCVDKAQLKELTYDTTSVATSEAPAQFNNGYYVAYEGITVSKLKKALADLEVVKVAKADGTVIESGKLGSGATFTLSSGDIITVIIYGEITGEGNINSNDIRAVLNHLSKKELLYDAFLTAADIDYDGKITTKDALLISGMY